MNLEPCVYLFKFLSVCVKVQDTILMSVVHLVTLQMNTRILTRILSWTEGWDQHVDIF